MKTELALAGLLFATQAGASPLDDAYVACQRHHVMVTVNNRMYPMAAYEPGFESCVDIAAKKAAASAPAVVPDSGAADMAAINQALKN